jgi:hypothetical protein
MKLLDENGILNIPKACLLFATHAKGRQIVERAVWGGI